MKHLRPVVFCILCIFVACGGKPRVKLPAPTPARIGAVERGDASWYGDPYHGRRTSNGEIYDMDGLTAAHLSLPFDTVVRVRNLYNGRTVDVRINDRGPFVKNRLIDLSREAARRLEMIGPGTTRVEVTVIRAPSVAARPPSAEPFPAKLPENEPCPPPGSHTVQVGSFAQQANAENLAARLRLTYPVAILSGKVGGKTVHRVTVGQGLNRRQAEALLVELKDDRIDGFLTEVQGGDCSGG